MREHVWIIRGQASARSLSRTSFADTTQEIAKKKAAMVHVKRHDVRKPQMPSLANQIVGQASLNKIARAVARLRHTVVHRLHLTSDEFLGQIHSALMLAGFLQDVRSTSTLQVMYGRVDAHAKKMDHDIEAVQQEINTTLLQIQREREALAQREQKLQLYTAQQNIAIPNVTSLALLKSIEAVLASSNPNVEVKEQIIGGHDNNAEHTYGVIVEDDDIESDEDQLRAELR